MFHPPWLRRNEDGPVQAPQSQHEKVQEVMNRMIFQAGVDYECVKRRLGMERAANDHFQDAANVRALGGDARALLTYVQGGDVRVCAA